MRVSREELDEFLENHPMMNEDYGKWTYICMVLNKLWTKDQAIAPDNVSSLFGVKSGKCKVCGQKVVMHTFCPHCGQRLVKPKAMSLDVSIEAIQSDVTL